MKKKHFMALVAVFCVAVQAADELPRLENPISVDYLQANLRSDHPRLVYTPEILDGLKKKLDSDPVLRNMVAAIRLNAEEILDKPLLTRRVIGRRLLHTSREMLYRINMLGVVYLLEEDPEILARINEELLAVCDFSDWNPSHFLDVAEMSMAVAMALDWTAGDLPDETVKLAKTALLEKGINPSWPADGKRWSRAYSHNNWNQVCNGGLIAAAIAVAQEEPELAAKTISRALDGMPNALVAYAPDGVYPEGSVYWGYGTGFSVVTIAMLESAFGSDFGISAVPGFMESAVFRLLCNAPSGQYYNFADCGDRRSPNGDIILTWFAAKTGNKAYFEKDRFLHSPESMSKLSRLTGAGLAWLSQYDEKEGVALPATWKGEGENPIVIFTGGENDPHKYYFGGKGGKATTSHGNMDAGSFVFELNGIRWVVDTGNQNYHALEKTGFNLWGREQDSERWTLLTKNNFGHSTVTINDEPFMVDAYAPLVDYKDGAKPQAAFDLTAVYGPNVKHAQRRFIKNGPASLLIEDLIEPSTETRQVVWQFLTTADVELKGNEVVLRQAGQSLMVSSRSIPDIEFSVVSLDPPPMELDRRIEGLKRLELRVPAEAAEDGVIELNVRLSEHK